MAKRGDNIYRRKDGRFEGRYAKGRRPNGSLQYGCVYGHTYEEVREKLYALKARTPEGGDISLNTFISQWLQTARKSVKPSTFSRYHDRSCTYIIPMLGEKRVSALTKDDVQRFADELRGRRNLSRSTTESIVTTLRSALRHAAETGLIEADPCAGVVIAKDEKSAQTRIYTRQEQMLLVMAAEHAGQSVELSVLLSLYAGLSTGEMCALKWRDVDFERGMLVVGSVLERVRVYEEDGGTKSVILESPQKGWRAQRRIPLPEGLTARLKEYGERMPGEFYVLSASGKPVEPRRLRAWLCKAEHEAGFEVTYRALRRTYAGQFMESNFGPEILSQMLGHSGLQATRKMQSYSAVEQGRSASESAMRKSLT